MREDRDYLLIMGYLGEEEAETLSSDIIGAIAEYICND